MIFEQLVLNICTTSLLFSGCNEALTASGMQLKLKSDMDTFENAISTEGTKKIYSVFGKQGVDLTATAAYTMIHKEIIYSTPLRPFADRVNLKLNQTSESVNLVWEWK